MKNSLAFDLGYADFISNLSIRPRAKRWLGNLLNWSAGLASYFISKGFGEISDNLSGSLEVIIVILHILFFLLLLGKGSMEQGFFNLINFFSSITSYFESGVKRIGKNILPYAVNIGILIFVFPWMVFGLALLSHFFLFTNFLENIGILNPLGGGDAVYAFFKHSAIVPFVLAASSTVMNWTFFNNNEE